MVCYGYLRVSTEKQNLETNRNAILEYSNNNDFGKVMWILETVSGRKKIVNRVLGQRFEEMKKGDIIVMSEYSRISRDFMDGMLFVSRARERGIRLVSICDDIPATDSAMDLLMLSLAAYKAQTERENISRRTKLGIENARKNGKILGSRPYKLKIDDVEPVQKMLKEGMKKSGICTKYNCTYITLRKFIKRNGL